MLRAAAIAIITFLLFMIPPEVKIYATGDGSGAECSSPTQTVEGNENTLSYTAPEGQTVSGVCIKSGTNMFGGTSHSGLLGDGTYESCYTVSGVGTQTVTVTRTGTASDTCQGLSHIDVFAATPSPTPTPTPTPEGSPSPTPTPTPTPTPAPTATPTTTGGGGGGGTAGEVAGVSATNPIPDPTPTPDPTGAVLGVSAELPATGPETFWLITGLLTLLSGTGLTVLGLKK